MTRWATPVRALSPALEWALWTDVWPRTPAGEEDIVLPLLPWRHRWAQLLAGVRDVTVVLMLVGLTAALVTDGGLPGRLAGALVLGALLAHVLAAGAGLLTVVDVRADHTGEWIRLTNVHPAFVEATEAVTTRPTRTPVLTEVPAAAPADDHGAAEVKGRHAARTEGRHTTQTEGRHTARTEGRHTAAAQERRRAVAGEPDTLGE